MSKSTQGKSEGSPLIGVLKEAIRQSELTLTELSNRTGVSIGQLSRFVRGERDLSLSVAEKLVTYFGLVLAKSRKAK